MKIDWGINQVCRFIFLSSWHLRLHDVISLHSLTLHYIVLLHCVFLVCRCLHPNLIEILYNMDCLPSTRRPVKYLYFDALRHRQMIFTKILLI